MTRLDILRTGTTEEIAELPRLKALYALKGVAHGGDGGGLDRLPALLQELPSK
mgnify:CR=1 FL=1